MRRNTLYGNLIRSVYALDGANGEFLADLASPIRLPEGRASGRLALIPAVRARHLRDSIQWTREAIADLIDDVLDSGEDACWEQERLLSDSSWEQPSETAKLVWSMEDELAELEDELAAL